MALNANWGQRSWPTCTSKCKSLLFLVGTGTDSSTLIRESQGSHSFFLYNSISPCWCRKCQHGGCICLQRSKHLIKFWQCSYVFLCLESWSGVLQNRKKDLQLILGILSLLPMDNCLIVAYFPHPWNFIKLVEATSSQSMILQYSFLDWQIFEQK